MFKLQAPILAPTLTCRIEDNQVLLANGEEYLVLDSELGTAIFKALDGEASMDEIVSNLSNRYPTAELYFTFMQLADQGIIVDSKSNEKDLQRYWRRLELVPQKGTQVADTIHVRADSSLERHTLENQLKDFGLRISDQGELAVIFTTDLVQSLIEFEADMLPRSALFITIRTSQLWIGPALSDDPSPCITCLRHRLDINQPARSYLQSNTSTQSNEIYLHLPKAIADLTYSLAAFEVAKWQQDPHFSCYKEELVCLDLKTLETTRHKLPSRPQCIACGALEHTKNDFQINQRSVLKENGFRINNQEETLARLGHLVSPITGVVRSLNPVATKDGVHNYTAGHCIRQQHASIESLRLATRDQSGGKGKTNQQAQLSGLCEALERYSAVYDADPPDRIASYSMLGSEVVHPNDLMLFSEQQYVGRDAWNAKQHGSFQFVPERFDEKEKIAWVAAFSLKDQVTRLVPMAYVHYAYDGPGSQFCRADSNGLAAGNCIEEAILQGLYELIERDAVAIWWYNQIQYPGVDLSSFEDDYFDRLLRTYAELNREVWVLDLTHDLNVPTFVALSRNQESESEEILLGFGTHKDAHLAITRALLEINQSLPAILKTKQEREAQLLPDFADVVRWWNEATIEKHPYLQPRDEIIRTAEDYEVVRQIDLKHEIEDTVMCLKQQGMDTLVYNLTRPDIGLYVAKVMVPGLRHFWRRTAPGRLYEVPLLQGLVEEATHEHQLNATSLFL